ncbi:MAG: hypothetical protein K2G09_08020 [Paramuribaculum sp.]|nr:hypothetical protein [Paramuribaculum sp.]
MGTPNYIILSAGQKWNFYSWFKLLDKSNIRFINNIYPRILKKLWSYEWLRNAFFCQIFWLPYIKSILKIKSTPTVLIIYDWGDITLSPYCINRLKHNYPKLKVVYIFTNIVNISGAKTFNLLNSLKDTYDQIFAFDPIDAEKYGFNYSKLIYTAELPCASDSPNIDLFYVGQAKDRHDKLIEIYKDAKKAGLKCLFFIAGVPEDEQYKTEDIFYNHYLDYGRVLEYMSNAKCIVDVIQGNSSGLTIKTCEAVVLDKKLITTNTTVKDEPFYNPANILVYTGIEDLNEFISTDSTAYSESDKYEFSPQRLFNQIN